MTNLNPALEKLRLRNNQTINIDIKADGDIASEGDKQNNIFEAAQSLLAEGCSVIPIQKGTKKPFVDWEEYQTRRPYKNEIERWFKENNHQLGLVTGNVSGGYFILDFDGENWLDSYSDFLDRFPEFQNSRIVSTGGGKAHVHGRCPEMPSTITKKIKSYPGGEKVELRCNGHQTLVPPSLHPSGGSYYYTYDNPAPVVSLERFNEIIRWIEEGQATSEEPSSRNPDGWQEEILEGVSEGERNVSLTRLAGRLIAKKLSRAEILPVLLAANEKFDPPLEASEVEGILDSMIKKDNRGHPKKEPEPEPEVDIDSLNLTEDEINLLLSRDFSDTENAERWAKFHGSEFLWIDDLNEWWLFDGNNWREAHLDAETTMKTTAKVVLKLALKHQVVDEKRIKIEKQCIQWKDSPGVRRALDMAHSINYKKSSDFDKDPYLFLCKNGVVDLKTGSFRKPLATDYLHKVSNVEFNPNATCPRWLLFLNEIFENSEEVTRYIQRWCGYTLTGDTREEKFLVCEGSGANGKSTLLEVLAWVMGTWGVSVPFATFKEAKWDVPGAHHHADVAQMQGRRFIRSVEVKERAKLNIERLKSITGRDKMSARLPYSRYNIEFYPVGKIWLAVNHLPKIYDTSESCWRRLVRVHFNYTVPEEQRDKTLGDTLKAEGSGILNWMIQGCLDWQREGLGETPTVVRQATQEYQLESTPVRQFVNEKCEVGKHYDVPFDTLFERFMDWWKNEEGDSVAMSKKKFARELQQMGFEPEHSGIRFYKGLRLNLSQNVKEE